MANILGGCWLCQFSLGKADFEVYAGAVQMETKSL